MVENQASSLELHETGPLDINLILDQNVEIMRSISRRGRTQFVYSRDGESKDALDNEAGPDEEDSAKVQDEEEARTFYHAHALLLPNHL